MASKYFHCVRALNINVRELIVYKLSEEWRGIPKEAVLADGHQSAISAISAISDLFALCIMIENVQKAFCQARAAISAQQALNMNYMMPSLEMLLIPDCYRFLLGKFQDEIQCRDHRDC